MTVIDHETASWFLVRDDTRLLLDVNCSHSAVSYPFLMELNADEVQAYALQGHEFITQLSAEIQYSAPGVRGNASPYRDRNVPGAYRAQVDAVTISWAKEHGKAR